MKKTSTNMGDEGFKLKTISTHSNKSACEAIMERRHARTVTLKLKKVNQPSGKLIVKLEKVNR